MQNIDLNAMINAEILDYFSSFETCEDEVKEHDDTFSIEFKNNTDASHTVNERHANNSKRMQESRRVLLFTQFNRRRKRTVCKFSRMARKCNRGKKEDFDEFERDYINYTDTGHDDLYIFSIAWKIRHENNGVFIDICDYINHYAFYPKLDDDTKHTIKVDFDNLEDIQEQLKRLF